MSKDKEEKSAEEKLAEAKRGFEQRMQDTVGVRIIKKTPPAKK